MQHQGQSFAEGSSDLDVAHLGVTGRKAWKTVKGKGEAVWPPHLEKALLKGLASYQPDTKSNKALNRFPRRNRFISEFIYNRTGEWRTAKQVSSRLQQLKESCKDDKILELLKLETYNQVHGTHRREYTPPRPESPPKRSDSQRIVQAATTLQDLVYTKRFCLDAMASADEMHVDLNATSAHYAPSYLSSEAVNPPTMYFSSRVALYPETFCAFFEGDDVLPLSTESCPLQFYGFSQTHEQLLWHYSAVLPRSIWHSLRWHCHPRHFRVLQNIIMDCDQTPAHSAFAPDARAGANRSPMVSVVHQFCYSSPPPPPSGYHVANLSQDRIAPDFLDCLLPPPRPSLPMTRVHGMMGDAQLGSPMGSASGVPRLPYVRMENAVAFPSSSTYQPQYGCQYYDDALII
ncbi:hypothetical protein BD626DRAFT_491684 [Schizophyllum amplum]|uniref:TEA domain-containing protein n=1 Tax=Schizophyllum amplum TaxID=97359 RepID=A0A550CI44_9AGAR|nr:hypothetical protein BD626DRAFT_491684 [Auriculariopsis ampla]